MRIKYEGGFIVAGFPRDYFTGSLMSHSLSLRHISTSFLLLAIAATCLMSTGCSTLSPMTSKPLPVDKSAVASGSYSVEMHTSFGAPKQYKGQLNAGSTVSEALAKSGAAKKFRGMEVEILRKVEKDGRTRGLRMPVKYEPDLRGPSPQQDYALLDGDRIVVKPDNSGTIVKLLHAAMGGGF